MIALARDHGTTVSLIARRIVDEVVRRGIVDEVLSQEPADRRLGRRGPRAKKIKKPEPATPVLHRSCDRTYIDKPVQRARSVTIDENYVPRGLLPSFTERRIPPTTLTLSKKKRGPDLTKTELREMLREAVKNTA